MCVVNSIIRLYYPGVKRFSHYLTLVLVTLSCCLCESEHICTQPPAQPQLVCLSPSLAKASQTSRHFRAVATSSVSGKAEGRATLSRAFGVTTDHVPKSLATGVCQATELNKTTTTLHLPTVVLYSFLTDSDSYIRYATCLATTTQLHKQHTGILALLGFFELTDQFV